MTLHFPELCVHWPVSRISSSTTTLCGFHCEKGRIDFFIPMKCGCITFLGLVLHNFVTFTSQTIWQHFCTFVETLQKAEENVSISRWLIFCSELRYVGIFAEMVLQSTLRNSEKGRSTAQRLLPPPES